MDEDSVRQQGPQCWDLSLLRCGQALNRIAPLVLPPTWLISFLSVWATLQKLREAPERAALTSIPCLHTVFQCIAVFHWAGRGLSVLLAGIGFPGSFSETLWQGKLHHFIKLEGKGERGKKKPYTLSQNIFKLHIPS